MAQMAVGFITRFFSRYQLLKVIVKILRWLIVIAIIFFLSRNILLRWKDVSRYSFTIEPLFLLISLFLFVVYYLVYGMSWYTILNKLIKNNSLQISRILILRIFFKGLFARYLPAGKVFNVGIRVELLRRSGLKAATALNSLLLEQFYFIGGALILFSGVNIIFPYPLFEKRYLYIIIIAILISVFYIFSNRSKLKLRFPKAAGYLNLSTMWSFNLWGRFILVNLLQGGAVTILLWSVYPEILSIKEPLLWIFIAYPVSRVAGQLAMVLPGGIGLRETVYVSLLSPFLPVQPLIITVALARIASILIELLIFSFLYLLSNYKKQLNDLTGQ